MPSEKLVIERVSPTALVESNLEWLLGDDLELVRQRLQQALKTGYPLLDTTLAAYLPAHLPRAIIVLGTTRLGHSEVDKRVALAAAIEMLQMAITLHDAIPRATVEPTEADRMLLGSSILMGDYVFSQASRLAAETDHPAVVAAFAQALAQVAERRVIQLLEHPELPPRDDPILFVAAAEAGALLVGLPRPIRYALREAAASFGEVLTDSEATLREALTRLDALLADRPLAKPLVNWLRSHLVA
jgi:geranylgeranyl pyrophosphate synthase